MNERVKIVVRGAVQGVGFRPFVYRLATALGLHGWVLNSSQGAFIEAEGPRTRLDQFVLRVQNEKPRLAIIQSFEVTFLDAIGHTVFAIRESENSGGKSALILPDIATCPDCLREINAPDNRRYRYPFTNCTHCGPRFTIIESLPYDRPNTSMKKFAMCPECLAEYHDPADRRFHAQPIACPRCGPRLELWDESGRVQSRRDADALLHAAHALRSGKILALKGLGGFQLMVDARDNAAVSRLRARKQREEKPFATMYPSLDAAAADCAVGDFEKRLLRSPEAPIVLLEKKASQTQIAAAVAPGNPSLGVMLPYTPLHHLLLVELGFPLVATSGNLDGEPICIDERGALARLRGVADAFLVHNRPIVRHADDSVTRVMLGRELVLRRARGYAPLPVHLKAEIPTILATGAHLKNTVALGIGRNVFISQHIGDLETLPAFAAFQTAVGDFQRLFAPTLDAVACDLHPDYLPTKFAQEMRPPPAGVQHHYAHVLACMAENELDAPVLGVSWDGTGFGLDETIWGGEFLRIDDASFDRSAHLRTFPLPGGETAIRQPRRAALGLLYELFGDAVFERSDLESVRAFSAAEMVLLRQSIPREINAPRTSSAGRLFDAAASLLGLRQCATFEGQAAMELEWAAQSGIDASYPVEIGRVVDWEPAILAMLADGAPPGIRAAKFHNTLAEAIVRVARIVGEKKVVLSGGCFQNRCLTERTVARLRQEGFHPYWHQRVPSNDGGIALGQVMAAARAHRKSTPLHGTAPDSRASVSRAGDFEDALAKARA